MDSFAHRATLVFATFAILMNVFLSAENRKLRFGKVVLDSRSEGMDVARWTFNLLVYDTTLYYNIRPSIAGMTIAWVLVLLAAQSDLYSRKNKTIVVALGVFAADLMLFGLYPEHSVFERLLLIFVSNMFVVFFNFTDSFWTSEIQERIKAEAIEVQVIKETERLRYDAMLGERLKFVMHEINNILFILEISKANREVGLSTSKTDSVAYDKMRQIADLVLRDVTGKKVIGRSKVREVFNDLELLSFKEIRGEGVTVSTSLAPEIEDFQFLESTGSLFYILLNLVKNSHEAVKDASDRREIFVHAASHGDAALKLTVTDSGPGLSDVQIEMMMCGTLVTSKEQGHGLGMRFVLSECEKNGFHFKVVNSSKSGTELAVIVPNPRTSPLNGREVA